MGLPVSSQLPAAWTVDGNTGVTTTIVRKSVPAGMRFLRIGMFKSTASAPTALWLFVAVGALSDSEEAAILAGPHPQRLEIPVCITFADMALIELPSADAATRYAFCTDAATESVGNRVVQYIGSML